MSPGDRRNFCRRPAASGAALVAASGASRVQAKARQAGELTRAYRVDSVPSIGVQGRFFASGQRGSGGPAMRPVVDFLIQRVRTDA